MTPNMLEQDSLVGMPAMPEWILSPNLVITDEATMNPVWTNVAPSLQMGPGLHPNRPWHDQSCLHCKYPSLYENSYIRLLLICNL
jgi:hypothetical protein